MTYPIYKQPSIYALLGLMILTRYHHFGDTLHLPDASLAVFFFAGFNRSKAFLGVLLASAGVIDYVAIANGTSGWCVSPAYVFLMPTYTVLWLAGRYCAALAKTGLSQLACLVRALGLLVMATAIAFGISNGSFYLFSGRFAELTWLEYFSRVARYFPPYFSATLMYGILGCVMANVFKMRVTTQASHNTAS